MGSMKRDTADAMANPIMKPLSSLVMNDNPSSTVVNVPPRVTVTEVKMEKATMGLVIQAVSMLAGNWRPYPTFVSSISKER